MTLSAREGCSRSFCTAATSLEEHSKESVDDDAADDTENSAESSKEDHDRHEHEGDGEPVPSARGTEHPGNVLRSGIPPRPLQRTGENRVHRHGGPQSNDSSGDGADDDSFS